MAIKIHCSSRFTCRPLGLGSFPTVFFARILVLSPRTPPPVFVLFIFRFVIWLVMTPRRVCRLSRRTISEKKESQESSPRDFTELINLTNHKQK